MTDWSIKPIPIQKYNLEKRLLALTKEHMEEQVGIWEIEGYDKRELYHIMHREFVRLYGRQIRDYEINEIEGKDND